MGIYLAIALSCAAWAACVARNKHLNAVVFGLLGFFIGVIGVLITYAVPAGKPPAEDPAPWA